MASVAATVVASSIAEDMLQDDGGAEAIKLMEGEGYKRRVKRKKSHTKMGGVVENRFLLVLKNYRMPFLMIHWYIVYE